MEGTIRLAPNMAKGWSRIIDDGARGKKRVSPKVRKPKAMGTSPFETSER
jgi:hypothetical protein